MRIHAINNDDVMTGLNVSSKLSPDWDFLTYLKDEGRKSATLWLNENFEMVGTDSSINIQDCYL